MEKIWDFICDASQNLHKKNADVQKFWRPIEKLLAKYDNKIKFSWISKKRTKKDIAKVMALPERVINGLGMKGTIEENHAIIQTVRIPINEKPCLSSLMKIALNIGQYTTKKRAKKWMHIDCYISKKDIKSINEKHKSKIDPILINIEPLIDAAY
jgi:hypothetical protein